MRKNEERVRIFSGGLVADAGIRGAEAADVLKRAVKAMKG